MDNVKQLLAVRRDKLRKMKEMGVNPYPNKTKRSHTIKELRDNQEQFVASAQQVTIVGRLVAMRRQGKIGFGNVMDESERIQIFVRKDTTGEENYELFKLFDLGDFVQISGECFVTKTGEYSVKASEVAILSKGLRPIPTVKEKVVDGKTQRFDEFADVELRYRKRYLDLLLNPQIKHTFEVRAHILREIRIFLDGRGYLEVDTPTLQPLYGGANARPFITHHNTLDMPLYLRIATELYLKRLIVGGFEKVYEIGKNFRNEGMDKTHNPEFTGIELYEAYSDLDGMMDITEGMVSTVAQNVLGTYELVYQDQAISLKRPWRRATMLDLIKEHAGFDASDFDRDAIAAFCAKHNISVDENAGPGKLITELFDAFVEPQLIQPTFVTDYPKEVSPLAKSKPGDPKLVERFEFFICGNEYGNAFTELNDPLDQRERLTAQSRLRDMGDVEANVVDEDFLEALEYGMPPTGGLGIGLDRLIMLFTNNTTIKEVILFPTMKPE